VLALLAAAASAETEDRAEAGARMTWRDGCPNRGGRVVREVEYA